MNPSTKQKQARPGPQKSTKKQARRPGSKRPGPNPAVRRALGRGESDGQAPLLVLGKTNYVLLGAGLLTIVLGFLLLATEEINISPVLLVLGYCILIPAGMQPVARSRALADEEHQEPAVVAEHHPHSGVFCFYHKIID